LSLQAYCLTMSNMVNSKKENTLGIRVDDTMLAVLEKLAKKEERSVSAVARILISEALKVRGIK